LSANVIKWSSCKVLTLLAFGYRKCGKQVSGHMLVNDLMSLLVMHY
jgi:hypothetical protein